jgi:hypothetical protein
MKWSDYQKAVFYDMVSGKGHVFVEAVAGSGKCLGLGTPVLMFDGTIKNVEDIVENDKLMGPDSEPKQVLSISNGVGPLFKINPIKGEPWICNDEHILTLIGTNRKKNIIKDISIKNYIKEYEEYKTRGGVSQIDKYWKLLRVPVSFKENKTEIEPYLLGLWIGDGATRATVITSMDLEIINYCKNVALQYGATVNITKNKSKAFTIRFRVGPPGTNKPHYLRRFWKTCIKNGAKHIPQNYLINSEEKRLQLLAGIIDTDGHYHCGYFEIVSSLENLADQYCFLARSLGFAAYKSKKRSSIKSTGFEGVAYRVTISGDVDKIPTKLPRKQATKRHQIKRTNVTGFSLEPIGNGQYYGFTLDGDGRFLLGDFTVTHNTSSLIESLKYLPKGNSCLLVAFNKKIADELKLKAPSGNIDARTLHSLGLKTLKRSFPNAEVDANKMWGILDSIVGKDRKLNDIKQQMNRAVALSKACLVSDPDDVDAILDEYDIDVLDMSRDEFIAKTNKAMLKSYEATHTVDYNDMIWFPNIYDMKPDVYQCVLIDECQDLNQGQLSLAAAACAKDGRTIFYGDKKQAIYSFTAAKIDYFNDMLKRLNVRTMPLSISYRCPIKVVAEAKQYVPQIESAPNAKEGIVEYISYKDMLKMARPGCFILSRLNAPLISLALGFIKQGVPCNIQGRDIGANLSNLIKSSKKKTIDSFLTWLHNWEAKEIKRLRVRNKSVGHIVDKAECLRAFTDDCNSIADMRSKIQKLFEDTDDNEKIICSTVHKSKGLQRDTVFILNGTFFNSNQEEKNIKYVAITRSAGSLYFVTSAEKKKKIK